MHQTHAHSNIYLNVSVVALSAFLLLAWLTTCCHHNLNFSCLCVFKYLKQFEGNYGVHVLTSDSTSTLTKIITYLLNHCKHTSRKMQDNRTDRQADSQQAASSEMFGQTRSCLEMDRQRIILYTKLCNIIIIIAI